MSFIDLEMRRLNSLRVVQAGIVRLKWLAAATRFELAMRRHDRALKYGYDPSQPRDESGRWTDTGGGQARIRLAGEIPTGDSSEIPKERPPKSADRTAALKQVARQILATGEIVVSIARVSSWLLTYSPVIESYLDPPKSLEELREAVSTPASGYDIHHVVEQGSAEQDGFSRDVINSADNLVRIPRMKHWEINAWYQTPNPEFGWKTPRQYLSGRSWGVRRSVGLDALFDVGVLKR